MFDYRYHALSLAAVLFALAVGVLIGVAIGDTNLVSSAKNGIVHNLESEVGAAQRQAGQLQSKLSTEEAFTNDLYPLAVHGLLAGRNVGLVFLGGSSDRVNGLVHNAITQAGGDLATVVAVREPLDLAGVAREASGTYYAALASDPAIVHKFGGLAGRQLVSGGALVSKELLSRVRGSLLSAFDGALGKLEGLVVVRTDPSGMTDEQTEASAAFESGLIAGVNAVGVSAVGVELSNTEPSQIPWFKSQGIASVDDLDTLAGQAALIYTLSDRSKIGPHGAFGVKSTADSLLPSVIESSAQP
ncbi:MAG TPA: copper transporter [Solirubrobacteraceae bacterium]|jgi:hypothetical protein